MTQAVEILLIVKSFLKSEERFNITFTFTTVLSYNLFMVKNESLNSYNDDKIAFLDECCTQIVNSLAGSNMVDTFCNIQHLYDLRKRFLDRSATMALSTAKTFMATSQARLGTIVPTFVRNSDFHATISHLRAEPTGVYCAHARDE